MAFPLVGIIFMTVGFCGIIAIISHYIKRLHFYRAAQSFSGPPALPVFGNALSFIGNTKDMLETMNTFTEQCPSPFRIWLTSKLYFVVYEAEHIKTILLSNNANEKDTAYRFLYPWIGTGLVSAPAAKSKIHRKLIIPTFNQKILDSFVGVFNEQSVILTKQMRKEVGKGEFDIFEYMTLCTLDIVCETAMGVTVNAQAGFGSKYVYAVKRALEILHLRAFKFWLQSDLIFNLTKHAKVQRECLEYSHGITNDVIHKKQEALKNSSQTENETTFPAQAKTKKMQAFLDLMMELSNDGKKLTDEELREEVDTMIVAANDTTATVSSYTLLMLANFPEIQDKVYQELCGIYGNKISSDDPIDKEDLNHMDYLERVIKETMRIFAPAPLLPRLLTGDIQIGDKTLPEGSSVILGILKLHRSEKYWPDPLKFDPDRFLPEKVSQRHPYCYVPFSGGARGCIGQKYAFMTLKILLATILRRYVVVKENPVKIEDIELKAEILLKPVKPLTISIVERTLGQKHQTTIKKCI